MNKLINKNTIQYIKHGYVLYGQNGLNIKQFNKDSYTLSELKKSIYTYLNNSNYPEEYKDKLYNDFLNKNFIVRPGTSDYYIKRTSKEGQQILLESRLKPDSKYKEFFRDPQTGRLYRKVKKETYVYTPSYSPTTSWNSTSRLQTTYSYEPVSEDILDENGNVLLNAYENGNFSKYHTGQDAAYGNWQGQKIAVRYNKDSKTWTYNPVDDNENRWIDADDTLSKYLNETYKSLQTPVKKSEKAKKEDPSKTGLAPDAAKPDTAKPDIVAPGVAAPGAAAPDAADNAESLVNYFDPLVTDPRTILRSTRLEKPATTVTKPKTTLRVLPKAVARPENMPLMNRSDVRYTISDITGSSPYVSSDIELVNSLANTSDKNIFKQALMNRLKMSKWDNEVALNRLNSLGIRGYIGGSDRKRLRNLINKGTTINGKIRS